MINASKHVWLYNTDIKRFLINVFLYSAYTLTLQKCIVLNTFMILYMLIVPFFSKIMYVNKFAMILYDFKHIRLPNFATNINN